MPIITATAPTNVRCNADELPIMVSKFCRLNSIPFCNAYASDTSFDCTGCVDGYRLDWDSNATIKSPKVCVIIPATTNCLKWKESTDNYCEKCINGYILYTNATNKWS